VLMLVMAHGVLSLLLFTFQKRMAVFYWFYLPSLLVSWIGYIAYEGVYIPRNSTGECSIRVDLLLIYPFLAFVTICTVAYFVMVQSTDRGAKE